MLKFERAPSAIPDETDRTTYLVIDASRSKGHVFREVPVSSTDLEQVLADLIDGQYVEPVRVIGFNVQEGWSRDMSVEVVRMIERRRMADGRNLPKSLCKFVAEQRRYVDTPSIAQVNPGQGQGSRGRRRRISRTEQVNVHQRPRPQHVAPGVAE